MAEDETPVDWATGITERRIAEAMKEGAFDNLPGRGKPLALDDDAHVPPEQRAAYRILKNAEMAPEWAAIDYDIAPSKDAARRHLDYWWGAGATALEVAQARSEYERLLRAANREIFKYRMASPIFHRTATPLPIDDLLAAWDAHFTPSGEK